MDYKELVVKSFRLVWRHKWLWVFGVFAGGGGSFGGNFNFNTGSPPWRATGADPRVDAFFDSIGDWVSAHLALIITLIVALTVFFFVWIILSIISQGALIGAAERLDKDEPAGFGESLKIGLHNFWSILGFGLLLFLIIMVPIMLIGVMVAITIAIANPFVLLLLIPLILLFIPAALVLGVMSFLGMRLIVIDGHGAVAALPEAWRLFWRRLGPVVLTWLISVGLAIAFAMVMVFAFIILILPTALGGYLVFRTGFNLVKLGVFIFIGLVILAAMFVAQGAFGAYRSVYWTLAFRQMRALDVAEEPAAG